jgi:uncharacterized protein YjiS (DUF1127 family)
MTIFPLDMTRFPELFSLLYWERHYESAELENVSDRSLEDIGLEPWAGS